jgi:branched-subunit amino acid ABC-type transport system permease component
MGLLCDFAKGFVIMIGVFWVFLIVEFVYMKLYAFALLFLITFLIPLSMIAFQYLKNRKKDRS